MQITIEGHIALVINALSSAHWALDILTDCIVNVKKGVLQLHSAPHSLLTDAFTQNSPSFPKVILQFCSAHVRQ